MAANTSLQISTIGLLPFLIASERISPQNRNRLLTAMQSVTADSAAWRLSLLNHFNLDEISLYQISQPVLITRLRSRPTFAFCR